MTIEATVDILIKRVSDLEREVKTLRKAPAAEKRFYTLAEVCQVLAISRSTAIRMMEREELRPVKRGGRLKFLVMEIERYVAQAAGK